MAEEIWKPIPKHPGYEASTLGHIRNAKTGKVIRAFRVKNKNQVVLYHDGKATSALVHNLVIDAFRPKTDSELGMVVHHKNEVDYDDRLENLELVHRKSSVVAKPVYAYQWGHLVNDFSSASEAAGYLNCSAGSIRNVCMGIGKSYRGYEWSYYPPDRKEDMEVARDAYYMSQAVYRYEGPKGYETVTGVYDNYMQAAEMNGLNPDSVLNSCVGTTYRAGGYVWEFADKYYKDVE